MPLPDFSSEQSGASPLPLEAMPASGGNLAAVKEGAATSLVASGITALKGATGDQTFVSNADAQKEMKINGYDPSVLPSAGLTRGYLDALQEQQSAIKRNAQAADQAGLRHTDGIVPSWRGVDEFIGGNVADSPLFVLGGGAAGLALKAAGVGAEAGVVARIGIRAGESADVMTGYDVARREFGSAPGDKDIGIYDVAHDAMVTGVLGGVFGAFGKRAPADTAIDHVLQEEGGETTDTGGLTKYGISAKAHPDVDISNLDIGKAREIYKNEYWDKIDGDNLPAPMQMTALDAAVNQGVDKANLWLKEAGGDPVKFNELRKAEYERLAAENPEKYGQYLNGWLARLGRVSETAPPVPAAGPAEQVPGDPVDNLKQGVADALTDHVPDQTQPSGVRPVWQTPEAEAQIARAAAPQEMTPDAQKITEAATQAVNDAKATHAVLNPEGDTSAFDTHMTAAVKEVQPTADFHEAVNAALQCALVKGFD